MNKNSIQMILVLLAFVVIAALAISFTHDKTKDKIEMRALEAQEFSLKSVLSRGSTAKIDSVEGFGEFWRAFDASGKHIGYAFICMANGYSSKIKFFCGIDLEGKVKGISIISQNETPGLGTRVEEPWFSEQYVGVSALGKMSDKITVITGATITTEAVNYELSKRARLLLSLVKEANNE